MNIIKRQYNELVKQRHTKIPKNIRKSSYFAETQQLFATFLAQVESAEKDLDSKIC